MGWRPTELLSHFHFRSFHPRLLDFFVHFASHAAAALGVPVSKPVHLPTERRLWTVLRGPFVHKKSQENFERKTHRRAVKAWDAHPDAVDMLVHSYKDVPTVLPDGLEIAGVLEREDPVDVLVVKQGAPWQSLDELPAGSVVGSSSVRRVAQLKRRFPQLVFQDVVSARAAPTRPRPAC